MKNIDPAALEKLREGAKADLVAASLGEALKLCIEAAGMQAQGPTTAEEKELSGTTAA
jgi:hypothetical protein